VSVSTATPRPSAPSPWEPVGETRSTLSEPELDDAQLAQGSLLGAAPAALLGAGLRLTRAGATTTVTVSGYSVTAAAPRLWTRTTLEPGLDDTQIDDALIEDALLDQGALLVQENRPDVVQISLLGAVHRGARSSTSKDTQDGVL
jgi:hypothetical protein